MSGSRAGGPRLRLILDLDTGIDDALALAYALGSPEVELVAVVCSYGNVTVDTAVRNTHALLELLGRPDVPVYRGADRPLTASSRFVPPAGVRRIHGENGLGDQHLACWCHQRPADGVDFLARALRGGEEPRTTRSSGGEMRTKTSAAQGLPVRYAPTGPLTNLAMVLVRDPSLARTTNQVTFMGGALAVLGNVSPFAEANIHNDPEAADVVFGLGTPVRMVGLDVTHQAVLTREDTALWRALGTDAGRFFADMTDHYIEIYEKNSPHLGGCALHDPLAVAAAIDPTFVRCLRTNLSVDLEGPARGRTLCDPKRLRDKKKDADVALVVDVPRFLKEFRTRLSHALLA